MGHENKEKHPIYVSKRRCEKRSLLNYVLYMLACPMCLGPYMLLCPTCLVPYVLACPTCLRPYVLSCLTCLVPYVSRVSCPTCFSCPTCSHAPRALRALVPRTIHALLLDSTGIVLLIFELFYRTIVSILFYKKTLTLKVT